ncbi:hypothetical protein GQ43DRAFT_191581 [Delitschia confertaspora ATCC 74209]|uniref:Uncharacterized protein n=1 Tax=Delitschia confertaspora ATCC 74209 TaxID=1513339 RepID=A0A9P4MV81_9PLEO|nr:hypothetical protein GQ43DRAFT_191581 [Delitschia confertaspora ATCC 74209]
MTSIIAPLPVITLASPPNSNLQLPSVTWPVLGPIIGIITGIVAFMTFFYLKKDKPVYTLEKLRADLKAEEKKAKEVEAAEAAKDAEDGNIKAKGVVEGYGTGLSRTLIERNLSTKLAKSPKRTEMDVEDYQRHLEKLHGQDQSRNFQNWGTPSLSPSQSPNLEKLNPEEVVDEKEEISTLSLTPSYIPYPPTALSLYSGPSSSSAAPMLLLNLGLGDGDWGMETGSQLCGAGYGNEMESQLDVSKSGANRVYGGDSEATRNLGYGDMASRIPSYGMESEVTGNLGYRDMRSGVPWTVKEADTQRAGPMGVLRTGEIGANGLPENPSYGGMRGVLPERNAASGQKRVCEFPENLTYDDTRSTPAAGRETDPHLNVLSFRLPVIEQCATLENQKYRDIRSTSASRRETDLHQNVPDFRFSVFEQSELPDNLGYGDMTNSAQEYGSFASRTSRYGRTDSQGESRTSTLPENPGYDDTHNILTSQRDTEPHLNVLGF